MTGMKERISFIDPVDTKKIIRANYEKHYAYQFDNLGNMEKTPESYRLQKLARRNRLHEFVLCSLKKKRN